MTGVRTVAVVQARLASSRLPEKVLADLHGQPMLLRIVERLRHVVRVDGVAVTVSTEPSDDRLAAFCAAHDLAVTRGPTDEIVTRFADAAEASGADLIVRAWGDCPLIDTSLVDEALRRAIDDGHDYVTVTSDPAKKYPRGMNFEVYRPALLQRIVADPDPFYREFPAEYVAAHRDELSADWLTADRPYPDVDLTVDYPEDLQMVRGIYERLYDPGRPFSLADTLKVVAEIDRRDARPRDIEFNQKKQERQS